MIVSAVHLESTTMSLALPPASSVQVVDLVVVRVPIAPLPAKLVFLENIFLILTLRLILKRMGVNLAKGASSVRK